MDSSSVWIDFVADADLPGQLAALFQLAGGQAGADAGDGHGPIAQGQLGRLGQHRAVQSAGEGHGATAVAAQQFQQAVAFGGQFGRKFDMTLSEGTGEIG